MKGWLGVIFTVCACATLVLGSFVGIPYAAYKFRVWRSPCTRVYDGQTLIYEGKSFFYDTKSRGTGTMYQEYEQKFILPRQVKEIVSNDIRIETVSCEAK